MEDLFDNYKGFFDCALTEFCDLHWPCSYTDGCGRCCKLIRARHNTKGHQDDLGIIASGDYQSSFTAEGYGPVWERQLKGAISSVQREFQREQGLIDCFKCAAGHIE